MKDKKIKREKKERRSFPEKEYYRVGINIATLRNIHGETQEELALSIGVSKAAICNYETGKRIPNRDELHAIAKHYNLTVSRLMRGDFSKVHIEKDIMVTDPNNMAIILERILPIISSEISMENKHFKKAFDLHCKVAEDLCYSSESPDAAMIEQYTTLYQKAIEEGVYDACVNSLWWPMYILIGMSHLSTSPFDLNESFFKATADDIYHKLYMRNYDDEIDKAWEKGKKELFEEMRPDIMSNLVYLKNVGDPDLHEIADYYIALGYLFNVFKTDLSVEESRMVGQELLCMCIRMNNEYAKTFLSTTNQINKSIN